MSVHEEIREQQKKLKGQGFKAHLEYFWEYYKIHTLVAIFVIILISMLVHDIRNNKPYGFYALMLNSGMSSAQDTLEEGFTPYAEIDTEKYSCFIDTSVTYNLEVITETTISTAQKIMANVAGGDLDVMVADSDIFSYYANQQIFGDLRDILSAEQLSKYEDRLVYVDQSYLDYLNSDEYQDYVSTGEFDPNNKYAVIADNYNKNFVFPTTDKAEMDNPVPVGIRLDGSEKLSESGAYTLTGTTPVLGIIINTKRPELGIKFIEYLLG
ncbi:hypothetical protein [Butyrivibrio sp. VCB2006]|uniref:hypothetical protein n=1 Tax=Butyrivibrio sp. VCB2006 TaxID=1280679 RepID=UPI00040915CF|nr:hypothetical protein [Butyrivibrio sp. VCB2006]